MILILTQCFPSRVGGIESLVGNLAINLGKTEKVVVFADSHNIFYDAVFDNQHKEDILVRRVSGLKYFRRRKKIKEIKLFIDSKKVKLVIADSWKSLELIIDYLNIKKIPTISLAHGNELLSDNSSKINRIKKILNKVTSIVANSLYTKNLVINFISSNIPINVVHPGAMDLRNIDEIKIENLDGNPTLLTLARLEKRKGHKHIILSIKEIVKNFPEMQYIIAGDGPEKKTLEDFVEKHNLNENIKFVGTINDKQKKYIFSKTDLMIMPTLDESRKNSIEGFGIAYLEAAFFGIPSIASNIGGTPEAVLHKKTGIIIEKIEELSDTLNELLHDQNYIKELGINAKNRAIHNFDWSKVAKKYLI